MKMLKTIALATVLALTVSTIEAGRGRPKGKKAVETTESKGWFSGSTAAKKPATGKHARHKKADAKQKEHKAKAEQKEHKKS